MSSKVLSAATIGLKSELVEVEADTVSAGLHVFNIVGLPDAAVKESRDRVGAAIRNSGFLPPHRSRPGDGQPSTSRPQKRRPNL